MFCQYQYYRWGTKKLQTMVDHSDEKYQCKTMSDCPYTGTTLINKEPWENCPAGEDDREFEEEDQAEESDTDSDRVDLDKGSDMMEENDETRARQQGESTKARKPGWMNKLKRLFRK